MSNSRKNPFVSAEQASDFLKSFQEVLRQRDQDLRTLGHGKALHALAEACGYTNWHSMNNALCLEPTQQKAIADQKLSDFPKAVQDLIHLENPKSNQREKGVWISFKLVNGAVLDLRLATPIDLKVIEGLIRVPKNFDQDDRLMKRTQQFIKSLFLLSVWEDRAWTGEERFLRYCLDIASLCELINRAKDNDPRSYYYKQFYKHCKYLEDLVSNLPGMTPVLYEKLCSGDKFARSNIPMNVKDQLGYITLPLMEQSSYTYEAKHDIKLDKDEIELIEGSLRSEIRTKIVYSLEGLINDDIFDYLLLDSFEERRSD